MWFSVGVGAFVIGLSQISSFFSCILLVYTFFWIQISLALLRHHTSILTILCLIRILLKRVQYQSTNDIKIYNTKILYYTSKTRIPNFKLKWIHVRPNFPSVPFILTYLILSTCWLTQLKFGFFFLLMNILSFFQCINYDDIFNIYSSGGSIPRSALRDTFPLLVYTAQNTECRVSGEGKLHNDKNKPTTAQGRLRHFTSHNFVSCLACDRGCDIQLHSQLTN